MHKIKALHKLVRASAFRVRAHMFEEEKNVFTVRVHNHRSKSVQPTTYFFFSNCNDDYTQLFPPTLILQQKKRE